MTNGEVVISNLLIDLLDDLKYNNFRNNTVEKLNVHLTFNPKEEYIDYGKVKPASRKYIENELNWYLSKDKSIIGHKGIENNPIWKSCATDDTGYVNSNYGKIVFDKIHNDKSQLDYAIMKLLKDKCTRQSIIIYTRPSLHWECDDNIHAKRDFTCTTHTQHFIDNNNKLQYIVNMRSNDAIFGLQNDYSWHRYVYFKMFNLLKLKYENLEVGNIHWNAGSLHVYDRHYDLLKDICNEFTDNKNKIKDSEEII